MRLSLHRRPRWMMPLFAVAIALGCAPTWAAPAGGALDWDLWRTLPVQDGGRVKPLDTLARETLRAIANRSRYVDAGTRENWDPVAWYMTMMLEWQGWGRPTQVHAPGDASPAAAYFAHHRPDRWDRSRLLRVDFLALRRALGLPEDQRYVSPLELSRMEIRDPRSGTSVSFLIWAARQAMDRGTGGTRLERRALALADRLWAYQAHRMGMRMGILPAAGSVRGDWVSVHDLLNASYDDASDPSGALRKVKQSLEAMRAAYLAESPERFRKASLAFLDLVADTGPRLGDYPPRRVTHLEVAYNDWTPFRLAWLLTTLAFVLTLLSLGTGWRPLYPTAVASFSVGLIVMLGGFGMRVAISGRAPVTNMYESVVYLAAGTAVLGLVFEAIWRVRFVLAAASAVTTLALILADNCPIVLDAGLHPLEPVLRSNFWLVTHVMLITLSYAAFALALGVGNITLGYFLVRSHQWKTIDALTSLTYRALQVGVLLLAAGTITGGVWADYSWGRFWGWDPKEVWALVALLGYLAVLHAAYADWVGRFGLAALSVMCFSLVVMAWYGVNFLLGMGLHSYGFGAGGQALVGTLLAIQFVFVAIAAVASVGHRQIT